MTVFFPDAVGSQGKDAWFFVPAISSKTAATVAELTATGVVKFDLAMRPGFGSDADTDRVNDERQGASIVYEAFGTTKVTLSDATFIDRPQDASGAATSKHITAMAEGAVGYMINRRGLGSSPENYVAPAAAQRYVGYPVVCGPQVPLAPGDSKAFEYKQSFIVTGARFSGTVAA